MITTLFEWLLFFCTSFPNLLTANITGCKVHGNLSILTRRWDTNVITKTVEIYGYDCEMLPENTLNIYRNVKVLSICQSIKAEAH